MYTPQEPAKREARKRRKPSKSTLEQLRYLNEWRPDWRDRSAYPDGTEAPSRHLAWEFLRRSWKYQKAFEMWEALPFGVALSDAEHAVLKRRMKRFDQRWQLYRLPDPRRTFDRKVGREFRSSVYFLPTWVARTDPKKAEPISRDVALRGGEALAIFSLKHDIGKQLEHLRIALENSQADFLKNEGEDLRQRLKTEREPYSRYLRLLDAEYAGASRKDMATQIFGEDDAARNNRSNARKALNVAEKISEKDYVKIILTAPADEFRQG